VDALTNPPPIRSREDHRAWVDAVVNDLYVYVDAAWATRRLLPWMTLWTALLAARGCRVALRHGIGPRDYDGWDQP